MRKALQTYEPTAKILQLPIPLTVSQAKKLFSERKDSDGLPRFRFRGCPDNHASAWSEWYPYLAYLLEEGIRVRYFSLEERFEVDYSVCLLCR